MNGCWLSVCVIILMLTLLSYSPHFIYPTLSTSHANPLLGQSCNKTNEVSAIATFLWPKIPQLGAYILAYSTRTKRPVYCALKWNTMCDSSTYCIYKLNLVHSSSDFGYPHHEEPVYPTATAFGGSLSTLETHHKHLQTPPIFLISWISNIFLTLNLFQWRKNYHATRTYDMPHKNS